MKALCITGADNTTLEAIAAPFYKAGMQPPQPLEREQEVNFTRWHQQVGDKLASKQTIGKLWENLASDLLLANLESDLWGWYEEQSVKALNFWADLEPSIHFLLVCTRPEDELCQKISQTEGPVDAEAFIKDWHQRHNTLLQFYLQHPQRCLLIDAQDALQHLNKQLLLAHDHWQLPLDQDTAEQQSAADTGNQQTQEQTSSIVSLVAREALKKTAVDIQGFYSELRAAQYPLTDLEQSEATTRKLFDWLKQDIDLASLNQLLTEYQALQQQAELAKQLPLLEDQSQNTRQQLEQAKQENELLLLQLHQVQEELESTFLSKQQLEKSKQELEQVKQDLEKNQQQLAQQKTSVEQQLAKAQAEPKVDPKIQQQLEESQQENELLLLQLHQVQEELESTFLSKQQLEKSKQELEQVKQDLEKNQQQLAQQKKTVEQQLAKAQAKPKFDPKIQQQLEESTQENELLLLQLHQVQEELEHYFLEHQKLSKEQEAASNENRQLKRQLKQQQAANQQLSQNWLSRFIKPQTPEPELEYDEVQLQHEQVNQDYEHLWINLKNPAFGGDATSQWSFRISCAAVKPGSFGQQPKLELPEQPEQLLHQWFEESTSDHGPKLELRFALPNSMDGGVWQQIDTHDQQLISALLKKLPEILDYLKEKGAFISRDWADWQKLVADMKRIQQAKTARSR